MFFTEGEPQCEADVTNRILVINGGEISPVQVSCNLNYSGVQAPVVEFRAEDNVKPGENKTVEGHMKYDIVYQPSKEDQGKTFYAEIKFTALPSGDRKQSNIPKYSYLFTEKIQSHGEIIISVLLVNY